MRKYKLDNLYQSPYPLENTNNLIADVNPNNNDLQAIMRFNVAKQEWEPYMLSMDFIREGNLETGDNIAVISTIIDDNAYKHAIPVYIAACTLPSTNTIYVDFLFIVIPDEYVTNSPTSDYLMELEFSSMGNVLITEGLKSTSPTSFSDDVYTYNFFDVVGYMEKNLLTSTGKVLVVNFSQYSSFKSTLNLGQNSFDDGLIHINLLLDYSKK